MGIFDKLFGKKKGVEEFDSGGTSPVKQELQSQKRSFRFHMENTETCLTILARCQTRNEIIEGFDQIARLLRQANDPLAKVAEQSSIGCKELPDEYALRLRDDFIGQCRAFLSATDGLREL